eukprot:g6840.t1
MGHRPCQIEAECRKEFLQHLGPIGIEWKAGGESYADLFIRRAAGEEKSGAARAAAPWSLVQLKTTRRRAPAWCRKMRHKLRTEKEALHGVVFLGYCSSDPSTILIERVHRKKKYDDFDPNDPAHNIQLDQLAETMSRLCASGMGIQLLDGNEPAADVQMAYSEQTLKEKRARAFFIASLRADPSAGLQYTANHLPHAAEYSCVDGILSCPRTDGEDDHGEVDLASPPLKKAKVDTSAGAQDAGAGASTGDARRSTSSSSSKNPTTTSTTTSISRLSIRIQEKLLSVRRERGKEYGLRCPMRRASGKPYAQKDADFLLLHARADVSGVAASPSRISSNELPLHGSALIPFRVLAETGIAISDSGSSSSDDPAAPEGGTAGRTCLAIYPEGAPGVPANRATSAGLLEKYYVKHGPGFGSQLARIIREERLHAEEAETSSASSTPPGAAGAGAAEANGLEDDLLA